MSVLPDPIELLSAIDLIQPGEAVSGQVANRPIQDLVLALAGTGGIFSQIEDLTNFSTIHKAHHITNNTGLLLHFDEGLGSAINTQAPTVVPPGISSEVSLSESKFLACQDMGGATGAAIRYVDLATSYKAGEISGFRTQGTLSFWAKPYSVGDSSLATSHQIWNWFNDEAIETFPLIRLNAADSIADPTVNFIEIGFDSEMEYWYAKFAGASAQVILAGAENSYITPTNFSDVWHQISVSWELDTTADLPADHIFEANLFVNGDLLASNDAATGLDEIIDFTSLNMQIFTGNWMIDELRYDKVIISDSELFSWYQSDSPFVSQAVGIDVTEFNHVSVLQFFKTVLSGAAAGNFYKNYIYYPEDSIISVPASHIGGGLADADLSGFLKTIEFKESTGSPAWVAIADYAYDADGNLLSTTFEIEANNNGSSIIQMVETYRYNTTFYDGETRFITPTYPTGLELVHNSEDFEQGFLQDTLIETSII